LIKIFKFKKINFLIYTFSIFIFFIFLLNSISFLKKYEDPFNEEKISKILEFNKVGFVVNDPAYSDSLCIMKKVYMISEISTCYENKYPRSRYSLILNINDNLLLDLKNKNLGIAFINKEISVQELFLLKRYNFIKSETIENIKFTNNSPLYISKYVPNYFRMIIYK
jgi:hypothetical protein